MTKFTILSGAALLAIAGAASAQPPEGPGPRGERGGDITRQQVIERSDQRFAGLDADNDGRITPEEARTQREQRREERRGRRAERLFDALDLDRNGSITREEMNQARERRQAMRDERGPGRHGPGMRHRRMGRHGPGGPGGEGGRGMRGGRGAAMFGEQGYVTREQFRERALAHFDRLDADRNGTVTAAERQAARGRFRGRMRDRRPG